jgi:S1-C subfamily serine protease
MGGVLDLVLLVAAVVFAISGYRQGLVVGALSFIGFFGGALLGVQAAPLLVSQMDGSSGRIVLALLVVFATALIGQALAVLVGAKIRDRLTLKPARVIGSIGGSIVSVIALLLVAWLVGATLAQSPSPWVSSQVRRSAIVHAVDTAIPEPVRNIYDGLADELDTNGFPEVFGPLERTDVPEVGPPNPELVKHPVVAKAKNSTVKVLGDAPQCGRRLEGTGFFYAKERVMTNAHVVAGTRRIKVELNGESHNARVIVYNPQLDLAVLYVPEVDAPALPFANKPAPPGADGVVVGFPLDGPYVPTEARVRSRRDVRGPDIYNAGEVVREVYSLRSTVRNGNSGGPLLSPGGVVYGVIFAAAADDPQTGFALTAAQAAEVAAAGTKTTERASTQSCD